MNNCNLYKCQLCDQPHYKNANGLVRHLLTVHKDEISIEDYFKKYISKELFEKITTSKILSSVFPLEEHLTNVCFECKLPKCKFQSFGKGFSIFCSKTCSNNNTTHKKNKILKIKKTLLNKYGVENVSLIKGVPEKVKKTKLLKYGNENFNNIEKHKSTNKKKYDTEFYTQTKDYKRKTKETSVKKYNVEHFTQADVVKKKQKSTNRKKYGVDYVLQSPNIRKSIEATNIKNHGVKSVLSLPEVRQKGIEKQKKIFLNKLKNYSFLNVELVDVEKRIFKCKLCDEVFNKKDNITLTTNQPSRFPRCLKCFPIKEVSNSLIQQELECFLKSITKNIIVNDRKLLGNKQEIDFYLPEEKIAIELNGLYYHSEFAGNKERNYHLNKTDILENQNIQLIHIFSDEWCNKKELIKSKLKYLLNKGKKDNLIHARKCIIKKINRNEANQFLNDNHLQGQELNSNIRLGAFYKEELISVMTFGSTRVFMNKNNQNDIVELIRFSSKMNCHIPGIASRLLKTYIKTYSPKKIISYADRRWSSEVRKNTVYNMLGFKFVKFSNPNYHYLLVQENYKTRHYRFSFRKEKLKDLLKNYDPTLTEWENMLNNKHDRIWDCGTIKYELEIS